jgi:hypothetical protein
MLCVVAPLLHNHELPADAVNTTVFGWQKVMGPPALILAGGSGLTVTEVTGEVLLQVPMVTVTL